MSGNSDSPCGPDSTRHTLLRKAVAQDPLAIDKLIRVYGPYLLDKCQFGLRFPPADAEDIVQETLVKVLGSLPSLEVQTQPGAFRAWLRKVLFSTSQDWLRRNRKLGPQGGGGNENRNAIELVPAPDFDEESQTDVDRWFEAVLAIIRADCDELTWKGLELYIIEGLSSAEVGEQLGKSERWAQGVKARIVRKLRSEFRSLGLID